MGEAGRPLADGEGRFRLLADRLPVPVWWCGPDKRLGYANEAWRAYTGRAPGEELGLGWLEAVHPGDRERCLACLDAALARREPFALELRLRRRDGAYRWVEDRGTPVADESGALAGYACCAVETHRQRRLRAGLARLGRALRRRDLLLEELHHRIKNTLQLIGSLLSLLARQVSAASAPAVRETARRVATFGLAHDALRQRKDAAGSAVELGPLLSEVTAGLREVARDRQVRVEVRADPGVTLPIGQAAPLGLVVNELVTNALKHGVIDGAGGTVTVEVRRRGDGGVEVAVADDGPGLPDDAWPPVSTASLGMPLVAGLARQAGASVAVTRACGTRFALTFPAAPAAGGNGAYSAAAAAGAAGVAASPGEA